MSELNLAKEDGTEQVRKREGTRARPGDETSAGQTATGTRARPKRKKRDRQVRNGTRVKVSADQLPRRSLEQALRVARALRDTLHGGPATWEDIAGAMNIGTSAQNKYYLWSAQAYNLVQKDEDKYSLSEIGRKIVAPTSPNEEREATVQAVLTPVVLSRFFTDYNGSPFPAEEHLGNILERKYGVPRERIEEAKTLIRENGITAGILQQQQDGSMVVRLDPKSTGIPQPSAAIETLAQPPVADKPPELAGSVGPATEFDRLCFVITPIGDDDSEQRRHANMVLKNVIRWPWPPRKRS